MNIEIPEILWGGIGRERQKVGQAIGNFSDSIAGVAQRVVEQQDKMETRQLFNDMDLEISRYTQKNLDKTDGTDSKAFDTIKQGIEDIKNKYMQKASNSRVQGMLDGAYMESNRQRLVTVDRTIQDKLHATTIEGVKIYVGDEVRKTVTETGDLTIGSTAISSYVRGQADYFGANTDKVERSALGLYYQNAIIGTLNNPQTAPEMIRAFDEDVKYKEQAFSYLGPEDIIRVQHHYGIAKKRAAQDMAYDKLFTKYRGNLEAIDRALDNPKTMKEFGITLEDAMYIKGFVGRSIETKERALRMRWDKTANDVFLNLPQMTPAAIDSLVATNDLSWQLGEQFKKDLKAVQDAPTNPQTYMRIYTQINDAAGDPDALTKARLEIYSSTGLSWMDKKTLLKITGEKGEKLEAHLAQQGADYIQRILMPTQGLGGFTKQEESKRFLDAMAAYENGILNLKKSGKPLTTEVVNQLAKDIANAYVLSPTELVKESAEKMKREREKSTGKKDKYGNVPGEKKIINGETFEYIGNDQWQKL